jgi:transcriptional regulator with XRE-family HTH domain
VSKGPELAQFLRARREALKPADVGLPDSGRRRTPGLRREEVATLAGVSIDYLVRLEQGRDVNPSPSVLVALAQALRLSDAETEHLARLAAISNHRELCPEAPASARQQAAPRVRQLLDRLNDTPAFVVGPTGDLLAWNQPWEQLVAPLGLLDGPAPNLARYVFTHPKARAVFTDWDAAADEQVSRLRAAEPRWGTDPTFGDLLGDLSQLPEFAARWTMNAVTTTHRGVISIEHPSLGELRIAYEVLLVPDDEQRLITWLPADEAASAAFEAAVESERPASPAHLRVVANE